MRFQVLDSWRGIAALLVALFHFRFLGHFYDAPFVRNGWLWVDFFFVLSGFVITHAYFARLRSGGYTLMFIVRRFGRLWPLHMAVLAAFLGLELLKWGMIKAGAINGAVPAFAAGEMYSLSALFTNVALVHSLGVHDGLTWNLPSWSISTEFYACVAFALACRLPRRIFIGVVAATVVICFAIVAQSGSYMNTTYQYGLFRCMLGFLVGCLTYTGFQRVRTTRRAPSTLSELGAIIAAAAFIASLGHGATTMAAPVVFSAVVLVFAFEHGRISKLLATKPFQKLGDWSYSIYMVHMLVFTVISRGLLVLERTADRSLRLTHQSPAESAPAEVFFFRTNMRWTRLRSAI